jgi:3-isopropylmalate/(R)-2-methylmalate dehydratase large subunit
MRYGKTWIRVPPTIKIILEGNLSFPITAKDIFLYLIGKYKSNLATYAALEYTGEIIEILPFYQRLCLCNLGVEIGAKIALIPYDKITEEYLNNKGTKLNNRDFSYFKPDYNAEYQRIIREDISFISPQIALPHRVDNVVPIEEVEDTPINQAVLGTCTQGHIEDLRMAADMLRNNSIKKGVRLLIFPGTRRIYQQALKEGIIEVLSAAGAIIAPPTCGCCVGLHMGIPADNEVIISSANRNFKGRMGNPEAQIFLASTPTVIASAIKGKITHPLKINGV